MRKIEIYKEFCHSMGVKRLMRKIEWNWGRGFLRMLWDPFKWFWTSKTLDTVQWTSVILNRFDRRNNRLISLKKILKEVKSNFWRKFLAEYEFRAKKQLFCAKACSTIQYSQIPFQISSSTFYYFAHIDNNASPFKYSIAWTEHYRHKH